MNTECIIYKNFLKNNRIIKTDTVIIFQMSNFVKIYYKKYTQYRIDFFLEARILKTV